MVQLSVPLAGLQRAAAAVDESARRIAGAGPVASGTASGQAPSDIVDLSAEMVALMQSKNAFAANANLAHAEDEMTQSLLNILA